MIDPHWALAPPMALAAWAIFHKKPNRGRAARTYEELLEDPRWRRFSDRFLRDNPVCCWCPRPATQTHHKMYLCDRKGNKLVPWHRKYVRMKLLAPVCGECHAIYSEGRRLRHA